MALKSCSLAAQGLWMRMLCIAAQHDPTGYVSVNSVGLSAESIARIVGVGVQETERLIGELSLNGVFARDRTGTIYNRRMVRDAKKALVARKNGKLGGNPMLTCRTPTPHPSDHELPKSPPNVTISKIREKSPLDKGQDKGGLNGGLKLKPLSSTIDSLSKKGIFGEKKRKGRPQIFVPEDTPQWNAWEPVYRKEHGKSPPKTTRPGTMDRGWYFPSEYPPSES